MVPLKVWRICKARHAGTAFSGEGARRFAGRWNRAGSAMVYTATSIALAALEVFVHLEPDLAPDPLTLVEADMPVTNSDCERISIANLPGDWRSEGNTHLQSLGTQWVESGRSLALMVPSAVVDGDWNVLINPMHMDMARVKLSDPAPFLFDERMFRRKG